MKINLSIPCILFSGESEYEIRKNFINRIGLILLATVLTWVFAGFLNAVCFFTIICTLCCIVSPKKFEDIIEHDDLPAIFFFISVVLSFAANIIIAIEISSIIRTEELLERPILTVLMHKTFFVAIGYWTLVAVWAALKGIFAWRDEAK